MEGLKRFWKEGELGEFITAFMYGFLLYIPITFVTLFIAEGMNFLPGMEYAQSEFNANAMSAGIIAGIFTVYTLRRNKTK